MGSRNFGAGTRDMKDAGDHFADKASDSYSSAQSLSQSFSQFVDFVKDRNQDLKQEDRIGRLERIDKEVVQEYASHLLDRYEKGEITASTAQDYLSRVNTVMSEARGDKDVQVKPVSEGGLPEKSGISREDKSTSEAAHNSAKEQVNERLGAQLETERYLGLRFEESAKLNAKEALKEAKERGVVRISKGTKGGRVRDVRVSAKGLKSLEESAKQQGDHHSMIPRDQTYAQYQKECYKEIADKGVHFHGERHSYANGRYNELTRGCKSSLQNDNYREIAKEKGVELKDVTRAEAQERQIEYIAETRGVSYAEAKEIDREARQIISSELGHGRSEITNAYIG